MSKNKDIFFLVNSYELDFFNAVVYYRIDYIYKDPEQILTIE